MQWKSDMMQEIETMKKLPYVAPTLRPIELITEEVLADNCKVDGVCENPMSGNPTTSFGS